jgi:xylan 1,4-beta-xylosidase
MVTIRNPVLRGFNPDPSILRVGEDYYLATSTFEWFPGVQIHHSRDLAHWRLLTRPLSRASQLDMRGEHASCGIWAPCLSYDDGLFYLVYTDVKTDAGSLKDTHNYVVTAPSIEGPWSEPLYLHSHGFDPSLFHAPDGRKWVLSMETDFRKGKPRFAGILMQEWKYSIQGAAAGGELVGPVYNIFKGTELGFTEGPHLYFKDGWYYLLVAEGGTSLGHAETVARSRDILGPYEADPDGPLITSRDKPEAELQKVGHCSLVQAQSGDWYLAHLCGRPIARKGRCTLGRETGIQQAFWTADGWLRVGPEPGRASVEVPVPSLEPHPWPAAPERDDFDSPVLGIDFQSPRSPLGPDLMSLSERPGFLRLKGRESIASRHRQALAARRIQAFRCGARTCLEFEPEHYKQSAGLVCMYDQENYYYLRVSGDEEEGKMIDVMRSINGQLDFPLESPVSVAGIRRCVLSVELDYDSLRFSYGEEGSALTPIGGAFDASTLSDEHCREGRFTGAFVGLCCQDMTGSGKHADFDWFEYREGE